MVIVNTTVLSSATLPPILSAVSAVMPVIWLEIALIDRKVPTGATMTVLLLVEPQAAP